jgi:uncharacterized protein (TIGR02453 family)
MLSTQTLFFLDDLKVNNNRDWFLANKKRYDVYKKEYHQLIADLLQVMKPKDAALEMLEVKNCTFRINRDIRFSKDKSPYKTHMGIWLRSGSVHSEAPGYYVHIEKDASFVGGGLYCPLPEQIQKMRKEINFFYDDLQTLLNEKSFKANYGALNREGNTTLKNPPRGYEKDHPAIEYLKLKSYTATQKISNSELTESDFVAKISQKLLALKPLNDFINRALKSED